MMPAPAEINSPEPAKTPGSGDSSTSAVVGSAGGGESSNSTFGLANGHKETGGGDVNPFAEYMWMENEEEYNRQVEEELLEQDFLERCFQEMLEEEDHEWFIPSRDLTPGAPEWNSPSRDLSQGMGMSQLQHHFNGLSVGDSSPEDIAHKSSLNPEAKEFVPGVKY
ncbi:polyadenylate-binding protein-interacting protein 2B-like [Polymixia lowei]